MSGVDAAAYCGVTPETFSRWVAKEYLPKAVIGRRWDRKALDLALDRLSGISATTSHMDEMQAAEEDWERRYAARKGAAGDSDRYQNAR
jgi:hypothetical protein